MFFKPLKPWHMLTIICLITKSVKWRLLIPFKTNSAKYQPDLGAVSAISAFQSLNKLSPMVADFRIIFLSSSQSVFSVRDHWFHAVCCTTIFSRMHHTRISNETETKTTNWVVLDAQKKPLYFPPNGGILFFTMSQRIFPFVATF